MITYRIKVNALGRITQLLDSQKIFGALMHLLSSCGYTTEVGKLVQEIKHGERLFMVSNLMPDGYIATPHGDLEQEGTKTQKELYQKLKAKKFVSLAEMETGKRICKIEDYIKIQESQVSQYRLTSEFYEVPGLKNEMFSVPTIDIVKSLGDEEVKNYCFCLAVNKTDEIVEKMTECIKAEKCFLRGQRASQGYNLYEVTDVIKEDSTLDYENAMGFLNLGMLLPETIDFNESKLKLFTSERRPADYWGSYQKPHNFISFIEAGSVVYLDATNELMKSGKSIVNSIYQDGQEERIIFGNSFLYPLKEVPKL